MIARLVRLVLLAGAVWSCSAGSTGPVNAVEPIVMEVASPLMARPKPPVIVARVGRWLPVAVTLSNTGDAVQGRLVARVLGAMDDRTPNSEFYSEVDLPANASRKRVWLYVRIERDDADKIEISFQGRGFRSMKAEFDLALREPQTRIVLTISDADEKLAFLNQLKGPGLEVVEEKQPELDMPNSPPAVNAPTLVDTLGAAHDMVPSRWLGLETVDLVVLHDFPHTSLSPAQLAALRGYVAGGGTLLALGGADWQRLAASPLADLWPLTPTSSTMASPAEVSELVSRYVTIVNPSAGDRLGGAPVVLTRGAPRPEAVAGDGGRAPERVGVSESMLLRRNFGVGHVVLLAVDPSRPPFLGWSGNTGLWRAIFAQAIRAPRMEGVDISADNDMNGNFARAAGYDQQTGADSPLTAALLQALASAKQLKTPPVSFIAWFLALYVFFLVPVNYCVLRYFDKRELAWITIPVIVLAFSVMSYAAALKIKGNAILVREVNLVQGAQGSGVARADAMLWLFSPRKTSYDVTSTQAGLAVSDYVDTRHAGSSIGTIREPDENSAFTLEGAAINMWDSRTFVASAVTNIGRGVSLVEGGGKVRVLNGTDRDLEGAAILANGRLLSIGKMKKGALIAAIASDNAGSVAAPSIDAIIDKSRMDNILPNEERQNFAVIAKAMLSQVLSSKFAGSRSGPLFIAWNQLPATPLSIGYDEICSRSLSLYVLRLHDNKLLQQFAAQRLPTTRPLTDTGANQQPLSPN